MKDKFTHQGVLIGANACIPDNYRRKVLLRETKNFFVTKHGTKYHKDGQGVGDWPKFHLTEITKIPFTT